MGIRYQQPQIGVHIDWSNPITRGLVGWFTPFDNCTNSGSATKTVKPYGVCANGQGSFGFIKQLGSSVTLSKYSIFALTSGTVTSAERASFGAGKSTASPILHVGHHASTSQIKMRVWCRSDAGSNPADAFTTADVFDGRTHFAGLTYDGSTIRSYVDGTPDTTNAFSGASFTFTHMALGATYRSGNVSVMSTHDVALGVLFDRELSEAEVRSISQNPWQIFKPIPSRIFAVSAASPTYVTPGYWTAGYSTGEVTGGGGTTYTLTAQGGSYTVSGSSVTINRNRNLTVSGGTYTLTGNNAILSRNKNLTAQGGTYSLQGANAVISRNRVLTAQGGIYTLTGQPVTITYTAAGVVYTLTALGGSYVITGQPVNISRNRNLTAQGGSYTYTGADVVISRNRTLTASGGTYSVTGASANLYRNKLLIAEGGSYTIGGADATLSRNYVLSAQGGSYSLQGNSATITWVGVGGIVWPSPSVVLVGTMYGPTGVEYTGTMVLPSKIQYNVSTGTFVRRINSKLVHDV